MTGSSIPWPSIVIALGSVLVLIGGFWAAIEQNTTTKKIEQLSSENQKLTTKLHETVTGGNSFPSFVYSRDLNNVDDPNKLSIYLYVNGNNPIFDVTLELADITGQLDHNSFPSIQDFINAFIAKIGTPLKGGTFVTGRVFPVGQVEMNNHDKEMIFRISAIARNGVFIQVTTLRRDSGGFWRMAHYKITKECNGNDELLKEETFNIH